MIPKQIIRSGCGVCGCVGVWVFGWVGLCLGGWVFGWVGVGVWVWVGGSVGGSFGVRVGGLVSERVLCVEEMPHVYMEEMGLCGVL